jgi:hypothetical protein
MITGAHTILFSQDADADRAFFRDVLKFEHVDAGGGWLIFALPPAELAVHPGPDAPQLYLMCDDIAATTQELGARGVETTAVNDQSWGLLSAIKLPGGGELGLYEPKHPTPR